MTTAIKKKTITTAVRIIVARRYGVWKDGDRKRVECRYCSAEGIIERNGSWVGCINLAFDHIVPECMGGASIPSNLQLICKTCNESKGKKNHDQFVEYRARLPEHELNYLNNRSRRWLE